VVLRFLGLVARFPLMATLARDYAHLPLVRLLDRTGALEAVVITNTSYSVQPLWMRDRPGRRFRAHLVWYSQNVVPLVLLSDRLRSDLPHYRHMAVDESWVWTDEFAVYLGQLGLHARQRVVGPILWYLPHAVREAHKRADDETQIQIAIFDITPIPDETALRIGLVHNYYRLETMTAFLTGIRGAASDLERATGRRVRLLLKHKRAYGPNHDRRYIDFVAQLAAEGAVELIDHQASLYSLTMRVDFSVVIPYSSPAYVASAVGRPAIYFDPANELLPTHLPARGVTFAGGREALLAEALAILGRASIPATCTPRSKAYL
jgi:polysaccharide biosynthesis PFTS motif protein